MNKSQDPIQTHGSYREIDLLDYLLIAAKKRWLFVRNLSVTCVIAALITLVLPKQYTSVATLLPPVEEQGYDVQSLFPELSVPALGISPPISQAALFVEILASRSVREGVLRRSYDYRGTQRTLLDIFTTASLELGVRKLHYCTTVIASEQGIVVIKVELPDRHLAAAVANAYVLELDRVNQEKSVSRAKNSRMYIEEQLEETERKLQSATQELATFQEQHKAISLEEQTRTAIESAGELKGKIVAKQIELGTLRLTMKPNNPQVIQAQRELEEMQKRYDELQYGDDIPLQDQKEYYIPIAQLPEVGRKLAELIREAKVQETVWQLLNQQYYQAKIQEARDTPTVQQLDVAVPAEFRSKPKRKLIVMVAGLMSLALTLFWVFAEEYYRQVGAKNKKLDRLKHYVRDDLAWGKRIYRRMIKR